MSSDETAAMRASTSTSTSSRTSDGATTPSGKHAELANNKQKLGTYTVYVVTWNVGSRFPDNISLRNLLGLQAVSKQHPLPDIYAIGLQEVNVQPQHQVLGLFKEDPWTHKTKELLKDHDYVVIKSEQMQGLLLTMFVRRCHVPHMRDIEAEFTRTGFGGIWGNKGAVSVRFSLYGCGLSFVVAHLAAHDHHLEERIEDYKQIIENHHYHVPRYREIYDHDYVFWFGDLNFRLQGDDSSTEVRDAVLHNEQLTELMQRDQLVHVRETTQEAFQLLNERLPAFPPTFKFKEGTSEYDLKRRPAWTDRIMYAVQPLNRQPNMKLAIEQCSYKSHPGYSISDHKPVTSEFTVKLYPNYRGACVKFKTIPTWLIGDEYTVEYKKPAEFEERDHDWIGVYPVKYASFTEYVAYEYVNQAESPPTPDVQPDYFDGPPSTRHGHSHHHHNRERLRRQQGANAETVRIDFSDDIELKHGEDYLIIYFQNTGLRGITSVAGVSNVFRAEKRSPTPRHVSGD